MIVKDTQKVEKDLSMWLTENVCSMTMVAVLKNCLRDGGWILCFYMQIDVLLYCAFLIDFGHEILWGIGSHQRHQSIVWCLRSGTDDEIIPPGFDYTKQVRQNIRNTLKITDSQCIKYFRNINIHLVDKPSKRKRILLTQTLQSV